jgi:hypothetical protein
MNWRAPRTHVRDRPAPNPRSDPAGIGSNKVTNEGDPPRGATCTQRIPGTESFSRSSKPRTVQVRTRRTSTSKLAASRGRRRLLPTPRPAGWPVPSRSAVCWRRKCLQTCPFLVLRDQRGTYRETGARLCPVRQQKMPICRMFSAGATGLEPATSGETGRSWRLRAERESAAISAVSRAFRPLPCGDWRAWAGACGGLPRDQRGMRLCLSEQRLERPEAM